MADVKIETVKSATSGVIGRAESTARGAKIVLDSSSRPQPDALTNSEAFLGAISSCGVTLIEMHARETGVPLLRMSVRLEGARPATEPRFSRVTMTFELEGVSQTEGDALVETYRGR
jgi:uncharacterized OsmC-like protein